MGKIAGFKEAANQQRRLGKAARPIAATAVRSALSVLARAGRAAFPGTIRMEIGSRLVKGGDTIVRGKVGLGVGAGQQAPRPHGHFQALGTKYIVARQFLRNAFAQAMPSAMVAARRGAARKQSQLMKGST